MHVFLEQYFTDIITLNYIEFFNENYYIKYLTKIFINNFNNLIKSINIEWKRVLQKNKIV